MTSDDGDYVRDDEHDVRNSYGNDGGVLKCN
jgi:hypothetical protein